MPTNLIRTSLAALVLTALPLSHALAGRVGGELPAPGIIGLVALGVIGAIAIARGRK